MKVLALLFIESELMKNIFFDEIVESFATLKSREKKCNFDVKYKTKI
jgi:hypothetical protein